MRYFIYSIQTNYLRNEENSIINNLNFMYFNFLKLLKSFVQTQDYVNVKKILFNLKTQN